MERMEAESGAEPDEDNERIDFLVSYARSDLHWAEWIAWCLEQAGYRVIITAWDFRPGSNFVYEMDQALKQAWRPVRFRTSPRMRGLQASSREL